MSALGLVLGFFVPIVFALLLNEVKNMLFKRATQTISYLPHFVSWVVAANIVTTMLSTEGPINSLLMNFHLIDKAYPFLTNKYIFWFIVVFADIWKETGWNAIIYLASIAGIDQEQYEAARVDGASRLQQIFYVTLPGIRPTIVVLLILSIGQLLNTGFEKQMLLQNSLVQDYSRVLDLFALEYGIGMNRYSFGTAIGIFKSVISVTLLLVFNGISRKVDQGSVM
jgi:putative aldouronate transport system permease protein